MFAAYGFQSSTGIPGSALLICQASASPETSCDYSNSDYIVYQENGGTSAASPLTAGIMALVIQKTGSSQGLANPVFYQLASKETYSACNSNSVAAGNSCVFYDTTSGSNAAVCLTGDPNCVTNTSGDQVGLLSGYNATTGYDLTTGLGSVQRGESCECVAHDSSDRDRDGDTYKCDLPIDDRWCDECNHGSRDLEEHRDNGGHGQGRSDLRLGLKFL